MLPRPRQGVPRGIAFLSSLEGEDAAEILEILSHDDPLGLGDYCADWIRAEGFLIVPERLLCGSLLEIAGHVSLGPVPKDDATWIGSRIALAATRILQRDAESLRAGADETVGGAGGSGDPDDQVHLLALREAFGLTPGTELLASVRFNNLPKNTRRAFFGLIVEQRSLAAVARRLRSDPETIATHTFDGLHALGIAQETERELVIGELLERESRGGRIL